MTRLQHKIDKYLQIKYITRIKQYTKCIKYTDSVFCKVYKIIFYKEKIKFQKCFKKHSLTYKKQDDIISL